MKKTFLLRSLLVASTALFLASATASAQTLSEVNEDLFTFVTNGTTPNIKEENVEVPVKNYGEVFDLLVAVCAENFSCEDNDKGRKCECPGTYRIVLHDYLRAGKDKEVTTGKFVAKIELNVEQRGSKVRHRSIYFVQKTDM